MHFGVETTFILVQVENGQKRCINTMCKQECVSLVLWSDRPKHILIPGVNRATVHVSDSVSYGNLTWKPSTLTKHAEWLLWIVTECGCHFC